MSSERLQFSWISRFDVLKELRWLWQPGFPAQGAKQIRLCGQPGPHELRQRQQARQEIRACAKAQPAKTPESASI